MRRLERDTPRGAHRKENKNVYQTSGGRPGRDGDAGGRPSRTVRIRGRRGVPRRHGVHPARRRHQMGRVRGHHDRLGRVRRDAHVPRHGFGEAPGHGRVHAQARHAHEGGRRVHVEAVRRRPEVVPRCHGVHPTRGRHPVARPRGHHDRLGRVRRDAHVPRHGFGEAPGHGRVHAQARQTGLARHGRGPEAVPRRHGVHPTRGRHPLAGRLGRLHRLPGRHVPRHGERVPPGHGRVPPQARPIEARRGRVPRATSRHDLH